MMLALVLGIYLPTKICAEKFGNVIIYVSSKILIIPDALIVLKSHFDVGVYFFLYRIYVWSWRRCVYE